MQDSILNKINVSSKIFILILWTISLIVARSVYLILFFTLLFIVLAILIDKSVKFYLDVIKKEKILLLFVFIVYIIIFSNILEAIIFAYKIIMIILLLKQFSLTVNFRSLCSGIKTLLTPFRKINIDKFSYNIVIFLYFINIYRNSKEKVFSRYKDYRYFKMYFSLKYNILPRLLYTNSEMNRIESSLKQKHNKIEYEVRSSESNALCFIFIILFVVVIFKEVILCVFL